MTTKYNVRSLTKSYNKEKGITGKTSEFGKGLYFKNIVSMIVSHS